MPNRLVGAKKPDHLVAPRPGERMLHDRHQLDVREAHLPDVRHERRGQLPIRLETVTLFGHTLPRSRMDLVDRHRPLAPGVARRTLVHPVLVAPLVAAIGPDHRGGLRRHFEATRVRIGLVQQVPRVGTHLELVALTVSQIGNEQFPDA